MSNSTTSTIKPNQKITISDHTWRDDSICHARKIGDDLFLEVTDYSIDHSFDIKFNKSDAIAIAQDFNLIPTIYSKADPRIGFIQSGPNTYDVVTSKEYINGELVEKEPIPQSIVKAGCMEKMLAEIPLSDEDVAIIKRRHMSEGGEE